MLFAATATGAVPVTLAQRGDLEQAWFHVAEALDPPNNDLVAEKVDELLQVARRLELRRLTPYSTALVVKARSLTPGEAAPLLQQAVRLDPQSPEAWLALATARFRRNAVIGGLAAFSRGILALAKDDRLAPMIWPSAVLGLLPVLLLGAAVWALIAIRGVLARLWHDLSEAGSLLKLGPNAPVFAIVAIALPLFAAGDAVWLLLWVFALAWAYFPTPQKAQGALMFVLVAVTPFLLATSFNRMAHRRNPVLEATAALQEHRYAPRALEDLVALSSDFADQPDYFRLLGDAFRQGGLYDSAAWAYREGLRLDPENGDLAIALGTIDYLQGDYNAALQAFDAARQAGADPVVSNFNLSLTLSQTYHFRESEEAMLAAKRADAKRLASLTAGRDQQQLIVPVFSSEDAASLLAKEDQVALLNRGLLLPPLEREATVFHPLAIGGFLALILALGHFLVRDKTGGLASACIKCGRPFCRRCKLSRESQSYCTQCVNIFLRKDMVAIETQVNKRRQVVRYQQLRSIERRVYDALLPGSGLATLGRPAIGALLSFVAVVSAGIVVSWAPRLLTPLLLDASTAPLQVAAGLLWVTAIAVAQLLPAERR